MMENQTRPNLFSFATSELSQDAFICWLAAWADPKFKTVSNDADLALHQTATKFIASLIDKHKPDYDVATISAVTVERQVGKLDILIKINEEINESKLAILIEDKTHTDHHSGQLEKYYQKATENYTQDQIIPIYFKTGYQSKFDVGKYKTYLRKEFLELLKGGSYTVKNAIYSDFLAHLENMEFVVNQFSTKPLATWGGPDWQGFFMALYESFSHEDEQANWNYVANPSGGFFGFWWHFETSEQRDFWNYIQLENNKLCYKIGFSDEAYESTGWAEQAQKIKSLWSTALIQFNERLNTKNTKIGKTMTVAKTDNLNSHFQCISLFVPFCFFLEQPA